VGVAVETSSGWLLHCGDALPFGGLDSPAPDPISRAGCGPHIDRIRWLAEERAGKIEILCSHLPLRPRRPRRA
jgi:glyoxylase-like metal-dependent hydrolase (beta-lactamase superfamily II)